MNGEAWAPIVALGDSDLGVRGWCSRVRARNQTLNLLLIGVCYKSAWLVSMKDLAVVQAGFVDTGKVVVVNTDGDSGWHGCSTGRGDRCCTGGVARTTVNHSQYWGASRGAA